MKRILLLVLFGLVSIARAAEEVPPDFLAQMEIAERVLTDKPVYQQLKKLAELSPERAGLIARFWKQRAVMAKADELNRLGGLYEKLRDPARSKLPPNQSGQFAPGDLNAQTDLIFLSFYYDHIEEIETMIRMNLRRASPDKK